MVEENAISLKKFHLKFRDSLEAWEKINEGFITREIEDIIIDTKACMVPNLSFSIENPYLPEDLDFGRYFNYSHKWGSLVRNYLNFENLKALRNDIIIHRHNTDTPKSYLFNGDIMSTLRFDNTHKNGKGCLLSMTVWTIKKKNYLSFNLRASEVTKRLALDLLLFQRLGEYIFNGSKFEISVYISRAYNDYVTLLLYHSHKDVFKILGNRKDNISLYMKDRLKWFIEHDEEEVKYKIWKRVAKSLKDTGPWPQLLVKDCKLPAELYQI